MSSIKILSVAIASIIFQQIAHAKDPVILQSNDIQLGEDPGSTMSSVEPTPNQALKFWIYQKGNGLSLVEGNFDDDADEELKYSNADNVNTYQIGLRHDFSKKDDPFLENIETHPVFAFECTVLPDETSNEVTSVDIGVTLHGKLPEDANYSPPVYKIRASEFGIKQTIQFDIGQNDEAKILINRFLQDDSAKSLNITLTKVSRPNSVAGDGVKNSSTVILDDFRLE
jgi:hypothetical protein